MKSKSIGTRLPALLAVLALLLCLLPMSAWAEETPASSVTFTFTDSGVTASGGESGYEIDGTALKITAAGVYTVTGSCAEGSVTVKKGVTGVTLVLKDLLLSASGTAPLICGKTSEVTLYIAGTVTLTDNENPEDEDSADEAVADAFEGAAVKVKSGAQLTITGTGTLNVNGNAKNGVKGAAGSVVTVKGGTLNITAANHGLASDHQVVITGGALNITAGNEGIKASPDDDDADSAGDITITGGTVRITAADDGIHADGSLYISGGSVTVSAGDDGLKAEYDLTIDGGEVTVTESYEGIEGATVTLNGGSGSITASDDGINAANSDLTGYTFAITINGGSWYVNAVGDGLDSNGSITVNGGVTEVHGAADNGNGALDSETGITVNGGTLLAVGMSGMAETPRTGVYVSFGAAGMGGNPGGMPGGQQPGGQQSGGRQPGGNPGGMPGGQQSGGELTQSSGSVSLSKGDSLVIKDSAGATLYSATAVRSANSVIFVSDDLTSGESYTLYINGSAAAEATAGGQQGQRPADDSQTPGDAADAPSAWAAAEVQAAIDSGLVPENLQHGYQNTVTRSEVARMFINLIEQLSGQDIDSYLASKGLQANPDAFSDTDDPAVLAANALGVIKGVGGGRFAPDATLTRAQIAAILNRVAALMGVDTAGYTHSFTDVSGHWVSGELGWASQNGIINGRGGGIFDPDADLTNQEAIAITYRALTALS